MAESDQCAGMHRCRAGHGWPRATAHATGLPPVVLKKSVSFISDATIAGVVTTAAIESPFPMGFPSVTMSGTTSWASNPHR